MDRITNRAAFYDIKASGLNYDTAHCTKEREVKIDFDKYTPRKPNVNEAQLKNPHSPKHENIMKGVELAKGTKRIGKIIMQQQTPRDDLMYRTVGEYNRVVPYRQLAATKVTKTGNKDKSMTSPSPSNSTRKAI